MKTIELVKDYVQTNIDLKFTSALKSVVKLSGGLTNYVYRLNFEDNSSFVLKYYPNVQSHDAVTNVSQNRYFIEKECLKLLGNHALLEETRLRIPKLFFTDDSNFVLVMQDAGRETKTLMEILSSKLHTENLTDLIDLFASEICKFSKFLLSTCGVTRLTHKTFFESSWNLIRGYYVTMLPNEAKKYDLEKELSAHLQKVDHIFQVPGQNEGVFTFGDLWPSMLILIFN